MSEPNNGSTPAATGNIEIINPAPELKKYPDGNYYIDGQKVTQKQKSFVDIKTANPDMPALQAATRAGYAYETAQSHTTNDITARPGTLAYFNYLLNKAGATDEKVSAVLADGLDAKRYLVVDKAIEERPDKKTQLDYAKYVNSIKGIAPAETLGMVGDIKLNMLTDFDKLPKPEIDQPKP